MGRVNKYIKLAKDIVIKPVDEEVEDKIIDRISNISESDKNLLDEQFLKYLEKNNSRLYLIAEKIRNNPFKFIFIIISFFLIVSFLVNRIRKYYLSSPEK